ncbi:hypothetical protein MNBD_GAMMA03-832 [hydrothermal vent metagenome]|uniref:Uncharacterized protein n=1 Tax=hydrothermal vent metagenome TaxID=652676 RepID=A0A3B0W8P5_9ZZZZ
MKKHIALYALSTAINKGSVLLFFPFLALVFSLEDFGRWSLAIIVSNLLIPVVSLNASAGILREGSTHQDTGFRLLHLFAWSTVAIGCFFYVVAYMFSMDEWIVYAIAISSAEAVLLLALTFIRVQEKPVFYFLINVIKMLALFALVLYVKESGLSLPTFLRYHFYIVLLIAIVVLLLQYRHYVYVDVDFKPIFIFCLVLIPHGVSQWVMSSSDRLIIDYIFGFDSVGIYSLAYNIALILMLLNSGLAMALPTYVIKNYQNWKDRGLDNKFIGYYTYISIVLLVVVVFLYTLDAKYFNVLGYYGSEMLPLIVIIYFSIYILGLYYFFANYLFYHRKAGTISKITLYAAMLNVVLTALFVMWFGVIGAALGTVIAYVYYLIVIRHETLKVEKNLSINLLKPIGTFSIALGAIYGGASFVI